MTYIERINVFHRWAEQNRMPAASQLLYFRMLDFFNTHGWAEWVQVDTFQLMAMMQTDVKSKVFRNRDKLLEAGLLEMKKGKKGQPNLYRLTDVFDGQTEEDSTFSSVFSRGNGSVFSSVFSSGNSSKNATDTILKKTKTKTKTIPPKSPQGDAFVKFAKGNGDLLEALHDFEDMRKQIKKPMTDRAKTLLVGKLDKLAQSPEAQIAILQQSILHSWQDVYALKAVDEKKPIQRVQRHDEELSEFEKAAVAKLMARHRGEEGNETGSA